MTNRSPEARCLLLNFCAAALCLLLLLPAGLALGLPDDRDQPIHITADKALRDEKQGFTVYSGNVQMNQGSMHLEADKLTIYHMNEEADKIVAEGRPAKLRQRPELDKGPVHAHADIIEYYKLEEKVHLKTGARIEQDGALVTGDSIDYFIADQLVKADSDQTLEGNRVQVVIPPSTTQGTVSPAQTAPAQATDPNGTDQQQFTTPAAKEPQEEAASGATDSE